MTMKPETSLSLGLATAVVVYAIFQNATPSIADIRVADEQDPDIDSAERLASWTAAGAVAGISLIAKDPTVFVIGGSMVIVLAWWHRHANQVNPLTGRAGNQVASDLELEPDAMPEAA